MLKLINKILLAGFLAATLLMSALPAYQVSAQIGASGGGPTTGTGTGVGAQTGTGTPTNPGTGTGATSGTGMSACQATFEKDKTAAEAAKTKCLVPARTDTEQARCQIIHDKAIAAAEAKKATCEAAANQTSQGNAPGNPQANSCTGPECGKVISSDFDRTVAELINPLANIGTFPELVLFVMKGFIFLIGIMSVLIIIIGGVRMVLSQGNQESVTKGKQTIIWAVAGLIVALLSFSLVSIVQNLLISKP